MRPQVSSIFTCQRANTTFLQLFLVEKLYKKAAYYLK
jgi:hypothetical protein